MKFLFERDFEARINEIREKIKAFDMDIWVYVNLACDVDAFKEKGDFKAFFDNLYCYRYGSELKNHIEKIVAAEIEKYLNEKREKILSNGEAMGI